MDEPESQAPIKHILKVLVAGEIGTGKSSIIRHYAQSQVQ
jgi:Mg-chelatase subunit ChlI